MVVNLKNMSKPRKIIDGNGRVYPSLRAFVKENDLKRTTVRDAFARYGSYRNEKRGITAYYSTDGGFDIPSKDEEYEEWKNLRSEEFSYVKIEPCAHKSGVRYAVALFSDAHIEETVTSDSVLGLNEYNVDIAEARIKAYFRNLLSCCQRDRVETLYFASLGDTISGFIHSELEQENGLTPSEAVVKAQSIIVSGLKYLSEAGLNIVFIGIVGNHSRTTKKIQHANGFKMSYEWIMYQNIKNICEIIGVNAKFVIPNSEMAVVDVEDGRRFIFVHGYQIKSSGTNTVCGIYPALNRLAMKWDRTFHQDKIYLGHFHSCVSIPCATVNGSIIGFNAYALSNGFTNEEPAQMYEVYDSEVGLLLTRKIYCK